MRITLLFLILNVFQFSFGLKTNLNGDWLVDEEHGKYHALSSKVPGGIYSDLHDNKIIDDPLFGENDQNTKWVGRTNWNYYRNFTVNAEFLSHSTINIVFDGLDTISNIYINNKYIGNSTSMFIKYIFNIKDVLREGTNLIMVNFTSPVKAAAKASDEQNLSYAVPPQCPPSDYQGECHVNQLRKMQASFSWDWGPSFPSMGIWKNVYLEAFNSTVIRDVVIKIKEKEDEWNLTIDTYFSNNIDKKVDGKLILELDTDLSTQITISNVNLTGNEYGELVFKKSINIVKSDVKKWWPNEYGEQSLYKFRAKFVGQDGEEASEFSTRVGFRTVELVQDAINNTGNSFYFKINGVPIFAKGSNSIPFHILPEKGQNVAVLRKILETAKDNHMNMIRVWGGGVYESDSFYDLADEFGIMIWQDFMFACALYPTRSDFLKNVVEEVRHQIKRIGSHPSVVLWAGNNENEAALANNWYGSNKKKVYNDDYKKLYIETIKSEYLRIIPDGLFITSSPTNGIKSDKDGGFSPDPYNLLYGDDHCYIYELDSFNSNIYPITRFASEYGFQSYPNPSSILLIINDTNLSMQNKFFKNRQHHPLGNVQMHLLIFYQFKLPPNDAKNYTTTFIFYTQIVQAMSIKIETEHYRKYRSILTEDGKGLTMGALYWQLNDVWIAPSWSGIDFTGKHKMLQFYIKDVFAPIIIIGHLDVTRILKIYVISDKLYNIDDVTVSIKIFKWNSFKPLIIMTQNIEVENSSSKLILSLKTDEVLSKAGCGSLKDAKKNCFVYLELFKGDLKIAPDNFVLVDKLKNSSLVSSTLKILSVVSVNNSNSFKIEISASSISIFVWLDTLTIKGKFSENGFLQINQTKTVYFTSESSLHEKNLRDDITISHLLDTTNYH